MKSFEELFHKKFRKGDTYTLEGKKKNTSDIYLSKLKESTWLELESANTVRTGDLPFQDEKRNFAR